MRRSSQSFWLVAAILAVLLVMRALVLLHMLHF